MYLQAKVDSGDTTPSEEQQNKLNKKPEIEKQLAELETATK